jgi:hypothetical protein
MLPPRDVEQRNSGLRAAVSRPGPNQPASAFTASVT